MLNIKGSKVFDLFATGSPFNFNEFKNKKGSVVQTILSHIDVIIHHKEINEVNLLVRRSFSQAFTLLDEMIVRQGYRLIFIKIIVI